MEDQYRKDYSYNEKFEGNMGNKEKPLLFKNLEKINCLETILSKFFGYLKLS